MCILMNWMRSLMILPKSKVNGADIYVDEELLVRLFDLKNYRFQCTGLSFEEIQKEKRAL